MTGGSILLRLTGAANHETDNNFRIFLSMRIRLPMWQAGGFVVVVYVFWSLSFSNLIMPANSKFGFSILVGGRELAEYTHPADSTRGLVESILVSPVTYWLNVREYSSYSEEMEEQKWPVTPYQILVCFLLLLVKLFNFITDIF